MKKDHDETNALFEIVTDYSYSKTRKKKNEN